jgi:peptidoglycan/LPS O-acetylase OafA/YrhL
MILLLVIGLIAPWVVHLAPPRQRPLGLVAIVAAYLLYAIFVANPISAWQMWAGLAVGIVTVLVFVMVKDGASLRRSERQPGRRRGRRKRAHEEDLTEGY